MPRSGFIVLWLQSRGQGLGFRAFVVWGFLGFRVSRLRA